MTSRATLTAAALTAYVAAIVGANYLTAHYGLVPVLPGLLVTAGTYSAGLALLARDAVQDTAGRLAALAAPVEHRMCGAYFDAHGTTWRCTVPAGHDGDHQVVKPPRPPAVPSGISPNADGTAR